MPPERGTTFPVHRPKWRFRQQPALIWRSRTVSARCPICGRVDEQLQIAQAHVDWQRDSVAIVRCQKCRAIVLDSVIPFDDAYAGVHWDWALLIEHAAGIEAIADLLAKISTGPGARMLDIGCGYGFGLDLGERLRGWHGIGLDPSPAAQQGRVELGIDIRSGILDDDFAPGQRFDVILASEVLEHIPDPGAFLRAIRARLPDDGLVLLTTPDADAVGPETPWSTLQAVLSIGHHEFLVDADGLRQLLEDVGLVADIWHDGPSLRAAASPTVAGLDQVKRDGRASLADLARYCSGRAASAPRGSSLALGMAWRDVKFVAYDGDFDAAAAALPLVRDTLLDRYGIDLDSLSKANARNSPPLVLAPVCYFAGVVAEYVDHDSAKANARFVACARTAKYHYDKHNRYVDPEIAGFEARALGERAIILARERPRAVRDALRDLDAAAARGACDAATVDDFKRRAEALIPPPVSRADRTRAQVARIRGGVRRRLGRVKP